VPQELLAIINQYGGKMKETYGVPVKEIQEAIKHGVRKINIDTDIRLAMTGAVRKFLAENPDKFDMREWLKPAREAAKAVCKQRYLEFGCEGQGSKIKGCRCRPWPTNTPRASWRSASSERRSRYQSEAARACLPGASGFFFHEFFNKHHDRRRPAHQPAPQPAPARARQGARQLRRRQRPHPDGGQRPHQRLRRHHGRAHPRQGRLLTQMALFWFDSSDIVPNHLTGDAPESVVAPEVAQVAGRSMLVSA
jgi:hypothetical protein